MKKTKLTFILFLLLSISVSVFAESARKILYLGNSFTFMYGTYKIVGMLAELDGHPKPIIETYLKGGKALDYHYESIQSEGQSSEVYQFDWDYIVFQEYSSGPLAYDKKRGPNFFFTNVMNLYKLFDKKMPNARYVMYETWARPRPHTYIYRGGYTIEQCQEELHTNYTHAANLINKDAGKLKAKVAPTGQVWEHFNWDLSLYNRWKKGTALDYHQGPKGALINAMTLYAIIFSENVSDIPKAKSEGIVKYINEQAKKKSLPEDEDLYLTPDSFVEIAKAVDKVVKEEAAKK